MILRYLFAATFLPLLLFLIPQGKPRNLLFLASLFSGLVCLLIPCSVTSFSKASLVTLLFLYAFLLLLKTPIAKTRWKVLFSIPILSAPLALLLPDLIPLEGVLTSLLFIFLADDLSQGFPSFWDRQLLLNMVIMPIFLVSFLYLPLAFSAYTEFSFLRIFWLLLLEALNVSAMATLFKGNLFKVRLKPSSDVTVKSLAFFAFAAYTLAIILLNLKTQGNPFLSVIHFTAVSGMILAILALSWQKGLLKGLRSYFLIHLYREKIDFYRLAALLHQLAMDNPWQEAFSIFLEEALQFTYFQGMKASITREDREVLNLQKGSETSYSVRDSITLSNKERLSMEIFLKDKPDELDEKNIHILCHLLGAFLSMALAQERRGTEEKFDLMGKLNRFIAHDLKNLSQTLRLYQENLDTLLQKNPEAARETFHELVKLVTNKTERAIQTLTSLTPPPPRVSTFNLREVLEEVMETLPFREKIRTEVPQLEMKSDRGMLSRIMENLLFNAYQKDPQNITITIRAHASQGKVIIEVADSGAPVPPEAEDKIFTPFFTTKPQGLGLGLYIVREYARALGGEASYHHRPGETTFRISIPRDIFQELSPPQGKESTEI